MKVESSLSLIHICADIDYGFAEAATTYGRIGVQVWIYKGAVLKSAKNAQKKDGGNTYCYCLSVLSTAASSARCV